MIPKRSKLACILTILAVIVLPLIGRVLLAGNGLPPHFLRLPLPKGPDKPGFNLFVLLAVGGCCLVLAAFFWIPRWFGFHPAERKSAPTAAPGDRARFPLWFWWGIVLNLVSWILMWGDFSAIPVLNVLEMYPFITLWAGFILALDGWVYQRMGGESLIATRPRTMFGLIITSWLGWDIYEYLNFFILELWYYPAAGLIRSEWLRYLWYEIAFMTVWPAIFEWYTLLNTWEGLTVRFANGPRLDLTKYGWGFLLGGAALLVATSIWPFPLFWGIWIAPACILGGTLFVLDIWTPFTLLKQGNWTGVVLMGLAGLCNGPVWELWNLDLSGAAHNPNFWKYDVPYFNWMWKFVEMPVIGLAGYIPFGIVCIFWWLMFAHIFGFDSHLEALHHEKK